MNTLSSRLAPLALLGPRGFALALLWLSTRLPVQLAFGCLGTATALGLATGTAQLGPRRLGHGAPVHDLVVVDAMLSKRARRGPCASSLKMPFSIIFSSRLPHSARGVRAAFVMLASNVAGRLA